jgi:hypothetical protein
MAQVEFKTLWFAPSEARKDAVRSISGQRFKPGVHEVPDELLAKLPKTAKILTNKELKAKAYIDKNEEKKVPATLKEFDDLRANSDAFSKVVNEQVKKD